MPLSRPSPSADTPGARRRRPAGVAAIGTFAVGAVAAGAVAVSLGSATRAPRPADPPPTAAAPSLPALRRPPTPAQVRDADIAFYERRAAADPTGAIDRSRLAALYLARSRETGSAEDVARAEAAARRALANHPGRAAGARQVLAASLLAEHRFAAALDVARRLTADDPDAPAFRAMRGEIEMELGRYAEARATFDSLATPAGDSVSDLSVAPRLARWAEVAGRPDEALRRMRRALGIAMARRDLPREELAWFWLRVGDLHLRGGRPAAADRAYASGLAAHPDDYRLLAARTHLAAVRGHWQEAIDDGSRAIAVSLDPATLGTMSDAYAALGDTARAAEFARTMEIAVSRQPGAYHRAWSLFLLDHDRRIGDVLAMARRELRTRRDIYGYDVLGWALHHAGRDAEARRAMQTALALGTRDAMLFYHAGMIERALGHRAAARELLSRALATNAYFHPTQPDSARRVLAALAAGGGGGP